MAYLFDNSDNQGLILESGVVTAPPYTLCYWGRPDTDHEGVGLFVGRGDTANTLHDLKHAGDKPDDPVEFADFANPFVSAAVSSVAPPGFIVGEWSHAACTKVSDSERHAFFNGGNRGDNTGTSAGDANNNRVAIGHRGDSTPVFHFNGGLAACAIWSTALSDALIADLANGADPWIVEQSALVFYAPLERNLRDLISGTELTVTSISGDAPSQIPDPPGFHRARLARFRGRRLRRTNEGFEQRAY